MHRAIAANPKLASRIGVIEARVGQPGGDPAQTITVDAAAAQVGWSPDVIKVAVDAVSWMS